MTELQRIEFAAAAMTCKRLGLMSHTTAPLSEARSKTTPCLPGRMRHHYKDGIACQFCGAVKGGKNAQPAEPHASPLPKGEGQGEGKGTATQPPSTGFNKRIRPLLGPKPIHVPRDL